MIKILIKYESSFIKEFQTEKDSITIGRKGDNDLVLDNPTISGHHCKIYKAGDSYFVEDLNSTNGTFLNGKKILKAGIKKNDVLTLVKYSLIFMSEYGTPNQNSVNQTEQKTALDATQSKYIMGQKVKGFIEVIEGPVDEKNEYELVLLSTYFGKQGKANIPAKSSSIFSSMPDMAIVITLRPDGYYLVPLKEGIAKYNGDPLKEKVLLKNDDIIELGATKFRFILKKL